MNSDQANGLSCIEAIISGASAHLSPHGLIAVEHGFDQSEAVIDLMKSAGLRDIEAHLDLAGQTINTTLGTISNACVGDTVLVPVSITMGSGISTTAISMAIDYDTTKLRCISSVTSLNSNIAVGFLSNCGLFSNLSPGIGIFSPTTRRQFRAAWFALSPVAFNGLMFNLRFVALASTSGSTPIAWDLNTAGNCEYADELADVIPNCFFVNGSASITAPAMITSQPLGNTDLTPGGNTTLSVVASGNPGYQWQELIGGGLWSNLTNGGVFNGVTKQIVLLNTYKITYFMKQLLNFMIIGLFKVKTWFSKSSYYSRVFWLSPLN